MVASGRESVPGKEIVQFKTANYSFFVIICSEEMYGDFTALNARNNPDFIVALSNDGFSNSLAEHYQHASMLVFRVIETRLPAIRVGNSGPTWLVNQYGEIQEDIPSFQEGIVLKDFYYRTSEQTFYTKHGDFFALGCLIAVLGLILFNAINNRKHK